MKNEVAVAAGDEAHVAEVPVGTVLVGAEAAEAVNEPNEERLPMAYCSSSPSVHHSTATSSLPSSKSEAKAVGARAPARCTPHWAASSKRA